MSVKLTRKYLNTDMKTYRLTTEVVKDIMENYYLKFVLKYSFNPCSRFTFYLFEFHP